MEWAHAIAPQANIILFEANIAGRCGLDYHGGQHGPELAGSDGRLDELRPQRIEQRRVGRDGFHHAQRASGRDVPGLHRRQRRTRRIPGLFTQRGGRGRHDLDDRFHHLRLRQRKRLERQRRRAEPLRDRTGLPGGRADIRLCGRFPTSPSTPTPARAWPSWTRTTTAAEPRGSRWAAPALRRPAGPGWWPSATNCGLRSGLAPMDGPTQTLPLLYAMKAADFHDITSGNNGGIRPVPATIWSPASAARWPTTWCPISSRCRRRAG